MPTTRQEIYDRIKKDGLENVKKSVANMNRVSAPMVDGYIKDYEESLVSGKREEREEESLSISRKALANSRSATKSARYAVIIAIIAIILNIITYIWPPN